MAQRLITEDDVDQALRQRLRTAPGARGTVWIHGYARGGRVLKVCVETDDQQFVVTIAWRDE